LNTYETLWTCGFLTNVKLFGRLVSSFLKVINTIIGNIIQISVFYQNKSILFYADEKLWGKTVKNKFSVELSGERFHILVCLLLAKNFIVS